MPSIKHRRRAKRRAERLVDEAIEAASTVQLHLAEKLIQRALSAGPANARFWLECARIARERGHLRRAIRATQRAVELSPGYAEARALLDELTGAKAPTSLVLTEAAAAAPDEEPVFTQRTERFGWRQVADELTARGVALLPALLAPDECVALRGMYARDECFEHEVRLDDARGRLAYRFFAPPLPAIVQALRVEVYARLAPIANRWNELVGDAHRWPQSHAAFLRACRAGGHARTSPILLRYEAGGFNAFHRDVHGAMFFPLQMAVSLGPATREDGGELALVDQRPGKRKRVRVVGTDPGDAVVFCTRDRLSPIAGLYGRQPVLHGVQEVRAERFAVGIPFHDYAG
jgi:uncharacterized protein